MLKVAAGWSSSIAKDTGGMVNLVDFFFKHRSTGGGDAQAAAGGKHKDAEGNLVFRTLPRALHFIGVLVLGPITTSIRRRSSTLLLRC